MRLNRRQFALTATAAATAMGVPVRTPQMVGNGTLDLAGPAQIPKFEEMVGVPYRLHGAGYNESGLRRSGTDRRQVDFSESPQAALEAPRILVRVLFSLGDQLGQRGFVYVARR